MTVTVRLCGTGKNLNKLTKKLFFVSDIWYNEHSSEMNQGRSYQNSYL